MEQNREFDAQEWMDPSSMKGVAEPQASYEKNPERRNAVVEETFELALMVMDYSERLQQVNPVFAGQILRSGTSVGSHTREAQNAESAADFLHKMKIGFKELEETDYRLSLCHHKSHYPHDEVLVKAVKRLFPLFNSIIHSTRVRVNQQRAK